MITFWRIGEKPKINCFICSKNIIGEEFGEVAWDANSIFPGEFFHFLICEKCFDLLTDKKTKKDMEKRIREKLHRASLGFEEWRKNRNGK